VNPESPFCRDQRVCASRPSRGLSPKAGKSPFDWECVVADAVVFEPVSTIEFPANREINREIAKNLASSGDEVAI
jgi:hypothetical protein